MRTHRIDVQAIAGSAGERAMALEQQLEAHAPGRSRAAMARTRRRVAGAMRHLSGRLEGIAYHLERRQPDPNVSDDILAQRVASTLGLLTRKLDLPRLRVSVHDGVVQLTGQVDTDASRMAIRRATRAVPGVRRVDTRAVTRLGDTQRPSQARRAQRSRSFREIVGAVHALDVGDEHDAARLAGSVLHVLLGILPDGERLHLAGHLPDDVRELVDLATRIGHPAGPRTVDEFLALVADAAGRSRGTADQAVHAVFGALHDTVPEEVADVAAVLPRELAELWHTPATT